MIGPHVSDVELRRLLRPAAWTVWTAVVDHATPDADGVSFAAVSVRGLALELGLAKDTVAGCIQRLAAHGLIERRPQAHVAGRFIASGYLVFRPEPMIPDVAPPSSLTSSACASTTSTPDHSAPDPHLLSYATPTAATSPRPNSPTSQLSFLSDL